MNLGGSIETIPTRSGSRNSAVDNRLKTLLMPVAARRQLNDLPDELWTKLKSSSIRTRRTRFKALEEIDRCRREPTRGRSPPTGTRKAGLQWLGARLPHFDPPLRIFALTTSTPHQ